jgi:hypothetical protein
LTWLAAQAARVSRKSDLGIALAYMLKRQDGFRLFLDDGCVDIDSNLVENAIRRPAMNRSNALFAGHDEGGGTGPGLTCLFYGLGVIVPRPSLETHELAPEAGYAAKVIPRCATGHQAARQGNRAMPPERQSVRYHSADRAL